MPTEFEDADKHLEPGIAFLDPPVRSERLEDLPAVLAVDWPDREQVDSFGDGDHPAARVIVSLGVAQHRNECTTDAGMNQMRTLSAAPLTSGRIS